MYTKKLLKDFIRNFKMYSLEINYRDLVSKIGEPLSYYKDKDFPDDKYKVDVIWGFIDEEGNEVDIWNYKDGHYAEKNIEDINEFSIWYNGDFEKFKIQFNLLGYDTK